jgi:hypothetical protein
MAGVLPRINWIDFSGPLHPYSSYDLCSGEFPPMTFFIVCLCTLDAIYFTKIIKFFVITLLTFSYGNSQSAFAERI